MPPKLSDDSSFDEASALPFIDGNFHSHRTCLEYAEEIDYEDMDERKEFLNLYC